MDQSLLVTPQIDGGRRLLGALDAEGFPVTAALWFYLPDAERWRYVVATPLVDERGPLETYTRIQSVLGPLTAETGISLDDIAAVSPRDPVIRTLGAFVAVAGPGTRIQHSIFGGVHIADAYIYRLAAVPGPATAGAGTGGPAVSAGPPAPEQARRPRRPPGPGRAEVP